MDQNRKILHFEYVVKGLLNWYSEKTGSVENNDLSKLKCLKLLFFVSAVNTTRESQNSLLDIAFGDYVAMPFGHVESTIYSELIARKGELNFYIIDNQKTSLRNQVAIENLDTQIDPAIKLEIDNSINALKQINSKLILFAAFDLVDLSHKWYSWKRYYNLANDLGGKSKSIPNHEIKAENKIFSLQAF